MQAVVEVPSLLSAKEIVIVIRKFKSRRWEPEAMQAAASLLAGDATSSNIEIFLRDGEVCHTKAKSVSASFGGC